MGGPGRTETASEVDPEASTAEPAPGAPAAFAAASGEPPPLAIGASVGRYTIRAELGRGGMGAVYAAHDPALDRRVAIKVLRPGVASNEARLRMQREAQALARLNHPNVVAVYDVGLIAGGTFVAMELVEGRTLSAWLAERRRPVSEIVDTFLAAGRGLAAAHAAGITHRDFKPSNVMLGERVRVVDFGLARPTAAERVPVGSSSIPLDAAVTHSRGVAGTPAYMAPEQARARWSPLSDQFSFARALSVAVTGALDGGEPRRAIPAWLRPILERALRPVPEARFPSLDAMLVRIARARHRTRRRVLAAAGVATTAALAAAALWWPAPAEPPDPCPPAEARFDGVWDDARRAAVRAAFIATQRPYAERTSQVVERALDDYRRRWLDTQVAVCRATRTEGRQSEALLDLQMSCLERRRSLLRELTAVWLDRTDARTLDTAADAAAALPALDPCAGDKALLEHVPLPGHPGAVADIAAIRARLDRARAQMFAGRIEDASAEAPALVAAADRNGWPRVRAEARHFAGEIAAMLSEPAAEGHLLAANQLAADARDDRLAAEALLILVQYLAFDEARADRARFVAELAEAAVARAGNDDRLRLALLRARAEAHDAAGAFAEALEGFTRARALAVRLLGADSAAALDCTTRMASAAGSAGDHATSRRLGEESLAGQIARFGPTHARVAATLNQLGGTAYQVGDFEAAAGYFARALAIAETTHGPDSLNAAVMIYNLGAAEVRRGELDRADQLLGRALAIRERMLRPDHPLITDTLDVITSVLLLRGAYDRAAELARRGLERTAKAVGEDHADYAGMLETLGLALAGRGEPDAAVAQFRRALEIRRKALGEHHPDTLTMMVRIGAVEAARRRCAVAGALMAVAVPGLEQAGVDASEALEVRGACELVEGRAAAALASVERAIAACEKTSPTNPECVSKHWLRARALDGVGRRADALAAATDAERRMVAAAARGLANQRERAAVRAWLAARGR